LSYTVVRIGASVGGLLRGGILYQIGKVPRGA